MFRDLNEVILLSKIERQSHLDLKSDCIEIGGSSKEFRGLLAHFLKTTIPSTNKIFLCHACNNGKCSNPKHLYWGTPSENLKDAIDCGARKNLYELTIDKYKGDPDKLLARNFKISQSRLRNTAISLSKEEIENRLHKINNVDISKFGWVEKVSTILNFSHSQVRRFMNKYYDGRYGPAYKRK